MEHEGPHAAKDWFRAVTTPRRSRNTTATTDSHGTTVKESDKLEEFKLTLHAEDTVLAFMNENMRRLSLHPGAERIRLLVVGSFQWGPAKLQNLCHDPGKTRKNPNCMEVAEAVDAETILPGETAEQLDAQDRARLLQGGAGQGGAGQGGTGQGFQGPGGVSNAAHFSNAGGMSHTHSITRSNHGGSYKSNPSYDIADHMSGLSMGAGKPSVGVPKPVGLSKGQLSSNNVFAALETLVEGESNSYGHPVYRGNVPDRKGKTTVQRVAVNVYGVTVNQSQYFCFDSKGVPFDRPPVVSDTDKNPERAAKLYEIAKALYSGKMAAAPVPEAHYEASETHYDLPVHSGHPAYSHVSVGSNVTYRPSTASSGGSSGEYTTRPGSRDGTTGPASYYESAPRTAPHDQHPAVASYGHPAGDYYGPHPGAHHDAPGSHPSTGGSAGPGQAPVSQSGPAGGGPSKPLPAASKPSVAPTPPRKVKLEKSVKGTFTVHGIDKGKPYIKGLDKKKADQHYELSWSNKNNQFYISLGSSRNDRIYLTGVSV